MRSYSVRLAIAVAASITPSAASAQHEAHQAGTARAPSVELAQCLRIQPVIENIIAAATSRAEAARLSNSPSQLRAAVDHLEAALRDIRAQSAPCSREAASTASHAGHAMQTTQSPAAPAAATDPHAGHLPAQPGDTDAAGIETWLKGYDAAFNAKDLARLAAFYDPDVTIYEGGGINNGWADYRDRHLGPELEAFKNLQFGHSNTKVTVLPGGQSAYATSEYFIKAKMGEREIDSRGIETLVLLKGRDGGWKIRHSHTSSRPPRRPAA